MLCPPSYPLQGFLRVTTLSYFISMKNTKIKEQLKTPALFGLRGLAKGISDHVNFGFLTH